MGYEWKHSPIAAVDKYFILHCSDGAEKNLDQPGLALVNSLKPSARTRAPWSVAKDEKRLNAIYGNAWKLKN